jgi:hypothetical protein
MNGRNAKLLRKMGSTTKHHKRSWNQLTANQKFAIRVMVKEQPELVQQHRERLEAAGPGAV